MHQPTQPKTVHPQISGELWAILILMVVSVCINYIDRTSLSSAAPLLGKEADLGITPAKMGVLLSAFFWTYALLQVASGWLVDRYGVRWVMAIGFFNWSAATAATGMVYGFGALVVMRLLLGAGESVAYPCYSKIIAANFAQHQRGLANSLIDAGTKFGPAVGVLAGGILMERYGWRPVFIVLGVGGMLWLPAWFKWMPAGHSGNETAQMQGPGFARIAAQSPAWATFIGHFSGNYLWYFLITWLPSYLVKERGFTMSRDGLRWRARFPGDRNRHYHHRSAGGSRNRERGHPDQRTQVLRDHRTQSGDVDCDRHDGEGIGGVHGLPNVCLHLVWCICLQPLGHRANHRRGDRSWEMDGIAKLPRQLRRRVRTCCHGICRGENRPIFLGLRRLLGGGAAGRRGLRVSNGTGGSAGLVR